MVSHQPGDRDEAVSCGMSAVDWSYDRSHQLTFPAVHYIKQNGERLGGRAFPAMRLVRVVGKLQEVHAGRLQNNVMCARMNRWWHWIARSATDSLCHFNQADSLYVRCFSEVGFVQRVGEIFLRLESTLFPAWWKDPGGATGLPVRTTEFTSLRTGVIERRT